MEKFCQSCGMPLSPANQGREQDGTKSTQYCQLCYIDGQWTEPKWSKNGNYFGH
ncbi:zinc ribbon domain-containing protein [Latilactobacillus sakei]|uniref:zinc ribbon domain-containing protein n=1 Tax=Latilactobacillus sakei TaxID=1599 RepID=UPI000DD35E9A|nr:zinc ribbon domain-containing protein [Latilactobacillus sakei]